MAWYVRIQVLNKLLSNEATLTFLYLNDISHHTKMRQEKILRHLEILNENKRMFNWVFPDPYSGFIAWKVSEI